MRMMSSISMVNCPIIYVYDYMPNVIASLNHKACYQFDVSTSSLAMLRRISNRLNGVGLYAQHLDKYELGTLRKIVKILTRDLFELENMNSTICKLFRVYGVMVSRF